MPPKRGRYSRTGARGDGPDGPPTQYQTRLTDVFLPKPPKPPPSSRKHTRSVTAALKSQPFDSPAGSSVTPKTRKPSSRALAPSLAVRSTPKSRETPPLVDISSDSEIVPLPKRRKRLPETPASKTVVRTPAPPSTIRSSTVVISSSPTLADTTPHLDTTVKGKERSRGPRNDWDTSPTRAGSISLFHACDENRNIPSSRVTSPMDDESDVVPSSQTQRSYIIVEAQPSDYRGVWSLSNGPKTPSKVPRGEASRDSVVPSSQTPERHIWASSSIHASDKPFERKGGSLKSTLATPRKFVVPGTADPASSIIVTKGQLISPGRLSTLDNSPMERSSTALFHVDQPRSDEGSQTQNTDTQGSETQDTMGDDYGSKLLSQLRLDPPFPTQRVPQYKDDRRWREYRLRATPLPSEGESYFSLASLLSKNQPLDENACAPMTPSPTKSHTKPTAEDVQLDFLQSSPLSPRNPQRSFRRDSDENMPPDVKRFLFSESYQESMEKYILDSSQSQA
ncbi:uncharacterized protein EI90DRAFT_3048871 [Cantharellus anzutake]|uniref:uncharacterized protein n=1 Tax=Cantharellus anzutake TaxID=1750568 RepID=UPI001904B32B|nr:uncharacterized protein EI90DRAFT_3048871 [Cantharellus anzutake]KAF8334916.1 hypothetical protein EI90DRAFT_3048871 [Cantharellus anzutake]